MTMTYSFERKFDPWATEPDFFDLVEKEMAELENAKSENEISLDENEISLDELADEELSLDEEYDL